MLITLTSVNGHIFFLVSIILFNCLTYNNKIRKSQRFVIILYAYYLHIFLQKNIDFFLGVSYFKNKAHIIYLKLLEMYQNEPTQYCLLYC